MIPSDFEPSASATQEPTLIKRSQGVIRPEITGLHRAQVDGLRGVQTVPSMSTPGQKTVQFDTHVRRVMQQGHRGLAADRRFPVAG